MTTTDILRRTPSASAGRRSDLELAVDQVRGIHAWTQAHRAPGEGTERLSREGRLDVARRSDVLARERQALRDWTERQLRASCATQYTVAATRAVIAHRQAWFSSKLAGALQTGGVTVVADLDNGADALGIVIAEQPDLLLVEDKLPMVDGPDLCKAVARWAPRTIVAVQVAEDRQVGRCLEAGAAIVFTRRIPPADIAAELIDVLGP